MIFYFKPTWDEQPGFCFYGRDRWSALCPVSLFLYCYEIFENRCRIGITRSALTGDVCICLHLITFLTSKISSGSSSICWVMFEGSLWGGQGKYHSDAGSFCCSRIRSSCSTQVCSSSFTSVATKIETPWWVLMGFITGSSLYASLLVGNKGNSTAVAIISAGHLQHNQDYTTQTCDTFQIVVRPFCCHRRN